MRKAILSFCLLAAGAGTVHGQMTTVIQDDFESGLGAWTARSGVPWPIDLNGAPTLFAANDPLLYQREGVTHDSQSAGFASNLDPWDSSLAAWMEKRFVGILPAATYQIHIEFDRYVYKDPTYRDPQPPDPYAVANRFFLLTDGSYDNPCFNFDGSMPASAIRSSYNAGTSESDPSANSGYWNHWSADKTLTTSTGNFELRLLTHEKYKGAEAVAWDNISLTFRDAANPSVVAFTFTEDFESGMTGWTARSYETNHPHDDAPTVFTSTDARLFTNDGNPGSTSAGFSSQLSCYDDTRGAWLCQLFPALYPPGTYEVTLDMDVYVYKDPAVDPLKYQALGNRVFVLTDDAYDNAAFDFQNTDPAPGLVSSAWRDEVNGIWQHVSLRQDVTTTTGDFEVRLLMQDNIFVMGGISQLPEVSLWANSTGNQAVAWDNLTVRIGSPCYQPRFDRDGDSDVDQDDFAAFQLCFTGPYTPGIDFDQCRCLDVDDSNTIDDADLDAFKACFSGPMVPATPECDDGLPPP